MRPMKDVLEFTKTGSMSLTERFDADKLNYILQNWELIEPTINNCHFTDEPGQASKATLFAVCSKYLAESYNGTHKTIYGQKRDQGRLFANNARSLQAISREIRQTIGGDFYYDYDVVNAHPVFLEWICEKYGIEHRELSNYINNRDELFKKFADMGISKSTVKQVYLAVINGGDADYNRMEIKPDEIQRFRVEMHFIQTKITEIYKEKYEKHIAHRRSQKDKSEKTDAGSFINILLCNMENNILLETWNYLQKPRDAVFCFDGLMLPIDMVVDIPAIQNHILQVFGVSIKLKIKPMDERLKLPDVIPKYIGRKYDGFETFQEFTGLVDGKPKAVISEEEAMEWLTKNVVLILNGGNMMLATRSCSIDKKINAEIFSYKFAEEKPSSFINNHDFVCHIKNPNYNAQLIKTYEEDGKKYDDKAMKENPKYKYTSLKDFMKAAFKNGQFTTVNGVTLSPNEKDSMVTKNKNLNLFTGFRMDFYTPKKIIDWTKTKFYKHLKEEMLNGGVEFDHFIAWIADIIQDPENISGTAHYFISQQGVGKGTFTRALKMIMGDNYIHEISDHDDYFSNKFNALYATSLLKVFEEMETKGAAHKFSNKLKAQITQTDQIIEDKGKSKIKVEHFARYMFYSNNPNGIFIEQDDRRFSVHKCNNRTIGNEKYFEEINAEVDDMDCMHAMYTYLRNYKYDKSITKKPYDNKARTEQIGAGASWGVRFLLYLKNNYTKDWFIIENKISSTKMTALIKSFIEENQCESKPTSIKTQMAAKGITEKNYRIDGKVVRAFEVTEKMLNDACVRINDEIIDIKIGAETPAEAEIKEDFDIKKYMNNLEPSEGME